jgi:hypothetical protein
MKLMAHSQRPADQAAATGPHGQVSLGLTSASVTNPAGSNTMEIFA